MKKRPRFLPQGDDLLLLRAAILPPEQAVTAWHQWHARNDIDKTPQLALNLFPAIYRNVGHLTDDEHARGILHGTYRRAWLRNQVTMSRVAAVIERLDSSGIDTLVLKGAALVNSVYEDAGTRWMNDVDVLVRVADACRAYTLLLGEGWRGERDHRGDMEHVVQVLRSVDLVREDGVALDLHWHVLLECCDPGDDDEFWDASVEVDVAKVRTRRLCNEDLLLHAIVHGSYWGAERSITWVMDACRILSHAGDQFDWGRLLRQATDRDLMMPLRAGLAFLLEEAQVAIPGSVVEAARATPVSLTERVAFKAQSVEPGSVGKMYRDLADYALRVRRRPMKEKLLGFVWYEKAVLRVASWWHVPFRLAFLAGRNAGRAARAKLFKAR